MEPFKEQISPELIRLTGHLLAKHVPSIDPAAFAKPLVARLEDLELKERVNLVAEALHSELPSSSEERTAVLLGLLHPDDENRANAESTSDGLCGWGVWPLTAVIGQHGVGGLSQSLEALREITKRGTSEFDVRPFIAEDPARAISIISSWKGDPNHHVRRLVSEGTRPRLPWGMRLQSLVDDPSPTLPILAALRDDPSEYVRRSVSNHLNDISKDHPDLVAQLATEWMKGADKSRVALLRHACRTLVKEGHPGALAAFGFHPPVIEPPRIEIVRKVVELGGELEFKVLLNSKAKQEQQLVVDYVVHHQKANGSLAPKVFKWTKLTIYPGEAKALVRRHSIKPITTRRYHEGEHSLSLRINGKDFGCEKFELRL